MWGSNQELSQPHVWQNERDLDAKACQLFHRRYYACLAAVVPSTRTYPLAQLASIIFKRLSRAHICWQRHKICQKGHWSMKQASSDQQNQNCEGRTDSCEMGSRTCSTDLIRATAMIHEASSVVCRSMRQQLTNQGAQPDIEANSCRSRQYPWFCSLFQVRPERICHLLWSNTVVTVLNRG